MLRIALCDDEADARDALFIQLEKLLMEGSEEIVYEFSSGSNAVKWLKNHPGEVDLLFLDVEMPGLNGMETAKCIREFDQNLKLVFVTGYSDYVFDGYQVGALDYIMKPVSLEKLRSLLNRVRQILARDETDTFVIKNADGIYRFALKDILYFYSDRRKVTLVTAGGEYSFYEKLDIIEERLKPGFVRIHQRYLVNARKVEHIAGSSVTVDAVTLPVSRALKEEATKKLARAMLL